MVSGCDKKEDKKYTLGIVETCTSNEKSRVTYFDDSLDIVNQVDINRGNIICDTLTIGEDIFIYPNGINNTLNDIIKITSCGSEEVLYNNFYNVIDYYVFDDCIYTIYAFGDDEETINSYISKQNMDTKDTITVCYKNIILQSICVQNNNVVASGIYYDDSDNIQSKIIFAEMETLVSKKEVDFTKFGINISGGIWINNRYYFEVKSVRNGLDEKSAEKSVTIDSEFNVEKIEINAASKIFYNKDRLFFIHYDILLNSGSYLTEYNLLTNESTIYNLNIDLDKVCMSQEALYVFDSINSQIYKFDINDNFSIVDETLFNTSTEGDSYVQGIFGKKIK